MPKIELTMVNKDTGEKFEFDHFFLVGNLIENDSLLTVANLQGINVPDFARIATGIRLLIKKVREELTKQFPGILFSKN